MKLNDFLKPQSVNDSISNEFCEFRGWFENFRLNWYGSWLYLPIWYYSEF